MSCIDIINQTVEQANRDDLLSFIERGDKYIKKSKLKKELYLNKGKQACIDFIKEKDEELPEEYKEILKDRLWRDLCWKALNDLESDYKIFCKKELSQRDDFPNYLNQGRKSNAVRDCFEAIEQLVAPGRAEKAHKEKEQQDLAAAKQAAEEKRRQVVAKPETKVIPQAELKKPAQATTGIQQTSTPRPSSELQIPAQIQVPVKFPEIGVQPEVRRKVRRSRHKEKAKQEAEKISAETKNNQRNIQNLTETYLTSSSYITPSVNNGFHEETKPASDSIKQPSGEKELIKERCIKFIKSIEDLTLDRIKEYYPSIDSSKTRNKYFKVRAFNSEILKVVFMFIAAINKEISTLLPNLIGELSANIENIRKTQLKEYHTTASKGFFCMKSISKSDREYFDKIEQKLGSFQEDLNMKISISK